MASRGDPVSDGREDNVRLAVRERRRRTEDGAGHPRPLREQPLRSVREELGVSAKRSEPGYLQDHRLEVRPVPPDKDDVPARRSVRPGRHAFCREAACFDNAEHPRRVPSVHRWEMPRTVGRRMQDLPDLHVSGREVQVPQRQDVLHRVLLHRPGLVPDGERHREARRQHRAVVLLDGVLPISCWRSNTRPWTSARGPAWTRVC